MMKQTLLIAITAGTLAGLLAGSLASVLTASGGNRGQAAPPEPLMGRSAATEAQDRAALEIRDLRMQLNEMAARIAWLETDAPAARTSVEPVAEAAQVHNVEAGPLAELASAMKTPGGALPENLKASVAQVFEDVRTAEREERVATRVEAELERNEARLAELVTALGLTPTQTDAMRGHLADYAKKRTDMFESARESGDFYNVRESMRTLRDENQQALALILDPLQLDQYQESEDDRRGGDREPGGRGGGGRGGRDR